MIKATQGDVMKKIILLSISIVFILLFSSGARSADENLCDTCPMHKICLSGGATGENALCGDPDPFGSPGTSETAISSTAEANLIKTREVIITKEIETVKPVLINDSDSGIFLFKTIGFWNSRLKQNSNK